MILSSSWTWFAVEVRAIELRTISDSQRVKTGVEVSSSIFYRLSSSSSQVKSSWSRLDDDKDKVLVSQSKART